MGDLLKYIIDAVAGIALFMALMLVFLVNFIINFVSAPSGPGENTLKAEAIEVGGRSHGKKLKLGVTRTGEALNPFSRKMEKFDDMGKLLLGLGEGYRYDDLPVDELVKAKKKIHDYDVVFLTCNTGFEEQLADILVEYVTEGGILYASDLRYDAIARAFPDVALKRLEAKGHAQELEADIVDPGLREALGKDKIHLKFDLGEWRPAAFGGPRVNVLLQSKYKQLFTQQVAEAPLMVKFQVGKGTVIFTSFHNEKQNSDDEKKLLQHLVFSLVTAGVDADINAKLEQSGFGTQRSNLLSTPKRNQTITKQHENKSVATLRFALGFRPEGAKLRFQVKSPDGKVFTKDCETSTIIEVPNAQTGMWTYSVTDLQLPYENFPFTVTVGEKK